MHLSKICVVLMHSIFSSEAWINQNCLDKNYILNKYHGKHISDCWESRLVFDSFVSIIYILFFCFRFLVIFTKQTLAKRFWKRKLCLTLKIITLVSDIRQSFSNDDTKSKNDSGNNPFKISPPNFRCIFFSPPHYIQI